MLHRVSRIHLYSLAVLSLFVGVASCQSTDPQTEATGNQAQSEVVAPEDQKSAVSVDEGSLVTTDSTAEETPKPNLQKQMESVDFSAFSDGSFKSWVEYRHNEGFYKIHFPEKPQEQVNMSNTSIGIMESRVNYVMKNDNFNKIYAVSFHDYPGSVRHSSMEDQLDEFFEDSKNGIFQQSETRGQHVELLKEEVRDYGEYPGRYYEFKKEGGKVLIVWAILFENRMYGMHIETKLGFSENPMVREFIESFEITYAALSQP